MYVCLLGQAVQLVWSLNYKSNQIYYDDQAYSEEEDGSEDYCYYCLQEIQKKPEACKVPDPKIYSYSNYVRIIMNHNSGS